MYIKCVITPLSRLDMTSTIFENFYYKNLKGFYDGWCKTQVQVQVQVQVGYFIVKNSFRRVEELLLFCGDF